MNIQADDDRMIMIGDSEVRTPAPKKPRTNGGAGGHGRNDGCCDNVGSRARDLLDKVPPCTGKSVQFDNLY
jgi:hypothetical protein